MIPCGTCDLTKLKLANVTITLTNRNIPFIKCDLNFLNTYVSVVDENDDLTAHLPVKIPSSAREVANHCAQVAMMRDTQGDVSYEHWRGVIGLIFHCEEGIDLAYEWSERRAETGHTQNDVDVRYNTWGSSATSCEFFAKCNPTACDGCLHKGKIKSPIILGRIEPEPESQLVEAIVDGKEVTVEVPALPKGYKFENNLLARCMQDKDGIMHALVFCNDLFWLNQFLPP